MNKSMLYTLVMLFAMLFALIGAACQPGPSPEEIVISIGDLAANGDLGGLMAIYAEDISYSMAGFSPEPMHLVGKQAVGGWISEQFEDNMQLDVSITSVQGNTVNAKTNFITDSLAAMGLEQLTCDETYIFEDGLLKEWSCNLTEDSINKFMAAVEAASQPRFNATFDGENCLVEGPESTPTGEILLSIENNSDSIARLGIVKLDDGLSATDVLASIEPGSSDIPSGSTIYFGTNGVLSGKTLKDRAINIDPGEYILSCVYTTSGETYPGVALTVSE